MIVAKNLANPKKIAKILKKVPFASFSFVVAVPQILDFFYEWLLSKK
jgi:hypothetical protein